jgi:hypothetical protein
MSFLTVLAAIGIVVFLIGQQIIGAPLRGKRAVVLPLVLTVIGAAQLGGHGTHVGGADIVLLSVSAVIAVAVGLCLGAITRLERRNGHLWAQLPKRGMWLWAGLIASRLIITLVAHGTGAHVAGGASAILLVLGLNRVAQALVVAPRAIAAGIPFAPERDGSVFGASWFGSSIDG